MPGGIYNLSFPTFLKTTPCFIVYPGVQRHRGKWFYVICLILERKPDKRRSVGALKYFDFSDLPFLVQSGSAASLHR